MNIEQSNAGDVTPEKLEAYTQIEMPSGEITFTGTTTLEGREAIKNLVKKMPLTRENHPEPWKLVFFGAHPSASTQVAHCGHRVDVARKLKSNCKACWVQWLLANRGFFKACVELLDAGHEAVLIREHGKKTVRHIKAFAEFVRQMQAA